MTSGTRFRFNQSTPLEFENELASGRGIMFHRPEHLSSEDPEHAANLRRQLEYFRGKKRLWEGRVQVTFKRRIHASCVRVGVAPFERVPLGRRQVAVHRWVLAWLSPILRDVHTSLGDDPTGRPAHDIEGPGTSVPLCEAADQYIAPSSGHVVDIMDDSFPSFGVKKVHDPGGHRRMLRQLVFEPGETHTFGFWGPSRFFSLERWAFLGLPLVGESSLDVLNGPPPMYFRIEHLRPGKNGETRHVPSRIDRILNVAMWSSHYPPTPERLRKLSEIVGLGEPLVEGQSAPSTPGASRREVSCHRWFMPCGAGIHKLMGGHQA